MNRRGFSKKMVLVAILLWLGVGGYSQSLISNLQSPKIALAQEEPTATPDAEGVIYVVVQAGNSLWSIAARAGISFEELLALNGLTEESVVHPGDVLIVGFGEPPTTPTPDVPTPTLPPPTVTATAVSPRTAICLTAFEDTNQDGIYNPPEPLRAQVAFTIFTEEAVVANYITDGLSEPHCIEGLEAGTYHITRSLVRDEILTTQGDWAVTLAQGSVLEQAFGSFVSVSPAMQSGNPTPTPESETITPIAPIRPAPETEANDAEGEGFPIGILLSGAGMILLLLGAAVISFLRKG